MYRAIATIALLLILGACWLVFSGGDARPTTPTGDNSELRGFRIP